jgi:RNA polymerase sigma-70 factor (ECF subfamily)
MSDLDSTGEITQLLRAHHEGDREAFDRLVPLVYDRMRRIARGQLAREGRGYTLSPTALVHEAYQQLVIETGIDWQDRSHFYGICGRAMRRILVDYARMRKARKRGGALPHVPLDSDRDIVSADSPAEVILAVDRAVDRLAAVDPRLARIVECRSFAGMTEEETAQALGTSLRTVQREWMRARAWLRKELEEGHPREPGGV